jgi:hypothetical protein
MGPRHEGKSQIRGSLEGSQSDRANSSKRRNEPTSAFRLSGLLPCLGPEAGNSSLLAASTYELMPHQVVGITGFALIVYGLALISVAASGPDHDVRNLMLGTPTGGGKYPFLVVIYWQTFTSADPRVSASELVSKR